MKGRSRVGWNDRVERFGVKWIRAERLRTASSIGLSINFFELFSNVFAFSDVFLEVLYVLYVRYVRLHNEPAGPLL